MKYKGSQLGIFLLIAITLTTGILLSVHFFIESDTIKGFLLERSIVQWFTLTVFLFILCMIADRSFYLKRIILGIRILTDNGSWEDPLVPSALAARCRLIDECKRVHGNRATFRYSQQLSEEDDAELDRIYGLLGQAIQFLLALGFFGTVWGISQSMFGSFGNLASASTEELKAGLGTFTGALGTAMDTTVLAIVCSLIATLLTTIVRWFEQNSLSSLEKAVSKHFSLERIFPAEDHECQAAEQLSETIRDQVTLAIKSIEDQGDMARAVFISEFQQIKAELNHPPEITVRYPSLNGSRKISGEEVSL
ncbi:MAG: MotA/TolQ/ExbB proton channel family protein [Waddliaceae bacterium]